MAQTVNILISPEDRARLIAILGDRNRPLTHWTGRAITDNYATHKQPNVLKWLADHPRWVIHFTPTSASWLNAVEGFFSALTRRRLRRGVFQSVTDLQAAIARYIREHNRSAKPFLWTASPKTIFDKLALCPEPSV